MDLARHLEIGAAALARGLVEARRLADVVTELATGKHGIEFWLGLLTAEQLDEILLEVEDAHRLADGSAATMPVRSASSRSMAPTALLKADTDPNPELAAIDQNPAPPVVPHGTDRYAEISVKGEGGMGAVIECMDRDLGRRVALKHLRPEFVGDKGAAAMLEREARVTGSLEHPNIVPVYDMGTSPKGGPFYVMRLVEQPTLGEVLLKLGAGDPEATATYTHGRLLRHFIQICETVDYAHSRGVVHCDLKPANVLLGNFGEVLVLDWGLAYKLSEGTAYRGGTPGYMAPEQLERKGQIDARTDIYALGVILYEMLAQGSFAESSLTTILPRPAPASKNGRASSRDPRRPSTRAPDRKIAAELDDICARALADDPAARFASARELAEAVAAFLEGTKERERKLLKADESCAEGDRLAESFLEFLESRPERAAEVTAMRAELAPWEPAEQKRALWDAEDRLAVTDALEVRTFQAAAAAYEQALEEHPGHPGARRGLARIYLAQLEDAGRRKDELDRIYFEELVKQYDDGTLLGATRAEGTLRVASRPEGRVTIVTLDEEGRRLVPAREQLGAPTPLEARLPPGRYAGTFVDSAGHLARFPLDVPAGKAVELTIDLEAAGGPTDGEVLVPAGAALLGSDEGGGMRLVDVPAFYIARFPVTFGEYLAFLDDLRAGDRDAAVRYLPRTSDGTAYWRWSGTGYVPGRASTYARDEADLMRLPAFGVDALAAEAYAAWLSARTGRAYRLPNEDEWEKAARGVDGRRYPWGDRFDASFCKMRQSRAGLARPEPPGAFPIDESPYGVRDMAGGIADWVVPTRGPAVVMHHDLAMRRMASCGGCWADLAVDCALHVKRPYLAVERSSRVGFRLVRSAT